MKYIFLIFGKAARLALETIALVVYFIVILCCNTCLTIWHFNTKHCISFIPIHVPGDCYLSIADYYNDRSYFDDKNAKLIEIYLCGFNDRIENVTTHGNRITTNDKYEEAAYMAGIHAANTGASFPTFLGFDDKIEILKKIKAYNGQ